MKNRSGTKDIYNFAKPLLSFGVPATVTYLLWLRYKNNINNQIIKSIETQIYMPADQREILLAENMKKESERQNPRISWESIESNNEDYGIKIFNISYYNDKLLSGNKYIVPYNHSSTIDYVEDKCDVVVCSLFEDLSELLDNMFANRDKPARGTSVLSPISNREKLSTYMDKINESVSLISTNCPYNILYNVNQIYNNLEDILNMQNKEYSTFSRMTTLRDIRKNIMKIINLCNNPSFVAYKYTVGPLPKTLIYCTIELSKSVADFEDGLARIFDRVFGQAAIGANISNSVRGNAFAVGHIRWQCPVLFSKLDALERSTSIQNIHDYIYQKTGPGGDPYAMLYLDTLSKIVEIREVAIRELPPNIETISRIKTAVRNISNVVDSLMKTRE